MRAFLAFLICIHFPFAALAVERDTKLEACLEKSNVGVASLQTIELRSWDRVGSQKVTVADVYLKRIGPTSARMLAYFEDPEDIRGTRLLAIVDGNRNEMFVYVPVLFKVRRITAKRLSTSVHGTDFSYEDLEWLYGMTSGASIQRRPDQLIDGRRMYVMEAGLPAQTASGYESVVTYVDEETCVPRRLEFFETGRKLRKVLTVDPESVQSFGDVLIPRQYLMEDLRDKTRTALKVRELQTDVQIPDQVLEPDHMKEFRGDP